MLTRKEYMADSQNLHRAYYGQFVTQRMQQSVVATFGIERLLSAFDADNHLNGIGPVQKWDGFVQPFDVQKALKACGDHYTLAGGVCIAKEAARKAIEDYRARASDM